METEKIIDTINLDGSFSFADITYVIYNDRKVVIDMRRKAYAPGDDTSDLPEAFQGFVNTLLWTSEVIEAWNAAHPANPAEGGASQV
jgi:hypothetical protein